MQNPQTPTSPKLSPADLQARLELLKATLSASKAALEQQKARKKADGRKPKTPSDGLIANTLAERFALEATGYKVWKAIGLVVYLEHRECDCGASHLEWKDEHYELENGLSHSIWYRHEGYGIEHQEDLPRRTEVLPEPKRIRACKECLCSNALDSALAGLAQMEFPF